LVKISAAASRDDDVVLIWDGDTVPLKRIEFVTREGLLMYYKSSEYHKPYFAAIKRLIGLDKVVDYSFITIEARSGCDWIRSIISSIDFD
jgi:hypothetical protein